MSEESYRTAITEVADGTPRPLWSVMIPTYNCAAYLRETLQGVLAQDPGPNLMQIEVVDDHSTHDDPGAVVTELGTDRVGFYRQPENVGHVRNFNTCLQRSRGHLIHLLHGDDAVREDFYRTMQRPFECHPEIGAAFCRNIYIDADGYWTSIAPLQEAESGVMNGWLERIAVGQRLQPPSMVVRRDVYERLGGFDRRIRQYGEDWEMWVRIAAQYPVWYEVEPLALYRIGAESLSRRSLRTGENIQDLRRAVEITRAYLPPDCSAKLCNQAHENHALAAIRRARRMLVAGDRDGMHAQIREAVKTRPSAAVLMRAARLLLLWLSTIARSPFSERQR